MNRTNRPNRVLGTTGAHDFGGKAMGGMHKKHLVIGIVLAVLANLGLTQTTSDGQAEIIVSASRDHREAGRIPANVTVLTAADIREANAATLVDLLRNLNGISFRSSSGNAAQAEISMRGFGENSHGRVLVLLDGRRLNNPDMAALNWAQIPVNSVERIEIMRGSQSALLGDNAVGGVINIITRREAGVARADLDCQFGSYGLNIQRLGAEASAGPLRYAVNLERNQLDGYRDRSAYTIWGGGARLGYDLNAWNSLSFSADYNDMTYQLPGGLTRAQMEQNPRQSVNPDDEACSRIGNVAVSLKSLLDDDMLLDIELGGARKRMVSNMESWFSYADVDVDSFAITPRWTWSAELAGRSNKLLLGFDAYADQLDSRRYLERARYTKTARGEVEKYTLGAYLRNEWALLEPLWLGLGARHEQARIGATVTDGQAPVVDDHKTHKVNALDADLTFMVAKKSKLFARAGTVYRFPFVDEQISYIGYGSDQMYLDIDAEKGQNYEIGADLELLENCSAGLTVFRLDMRDEIAYNAVNMRNENLDQTRRQGLESRAEWTQPQVLRVGVSYTLTDAGFTGGDNDGKAVPLAPRHKGSGGIRFFLPFDLAVDGTAAFVGRQYMGGDNANGGEMLDAFATVDLALRWMPSRPVWPELNVFVGVDNVLDRQYADVAYMGWLPDGAFSGLYYPAPGRAYKAGLACRF